MILRVFIHAEEEYNSESIEGTEFTLDTEFPDEKQMFMLYAAFQNLRNQIKEKE